GGACRDRGGPPDPASPPRRGGRPPGWRGCQAGGSSSRGPLGGNDTRAASRRGQRTQGQPMLLPLRAVVCPKRSASAADLDAERADGAADPLARIEGAIAAPVAAGESIAAADGQADVAGQAPPRGDLALRPQEAAPDAGGGRDGVCAGQSAAPCRRRPQPIAGRQAYTMR